MEPFSDALINREKGVMYCAKRTFPRICSIVLFLPYFFIFTLLPGVIAENGKKTRAENVTGKRSAVIRNSTSLVSLGLINLN